MAMRICEIFTSIQGESSYAGLPCTFIRVTGCNLRCTYCDTTYVYDEGAEVPLEEIMQNVRDAGTGLVEITGGEPLLQHEIHLLVSGLLEEGYTLLIETNGSQSIAGIDPRAVVILDIKTPGSGMHEKMDLSNLAVVKPSAEIKFVITGREDYQWSKDMIRAHGLSEKCRILMSPAYGTLLPSDLARWILEDRLKVRLNIQLHKYIFDPERRGV